MSGGIPDPRTRKRVLRAITVASIVVVGAPVLGIVLMIGWWLASPAVLAQINERTITALHADLRPGTTRNDAYAWLHEHGLRATNAAFAHWTPMGPRGWRRIDDGAWPQPHQAIPRGDGVAMFHVVRHPANPEVSVVLDAGWTGACGGQIAEEITFDDRDRIASITDNPPAWTCL